jgi:hypothetical protein
MLSLGAQDGAMSSGDKHFSLLNLPSDSRA